MVFSIKYAFLLATLIAANLIFAQDSLDSSPRNPPPGSDPAEEYGDGSSQNRFFFTRLVACNSSSQAGRTCASCRQTLLCTSNNIGILRTCHGLLRYCNQGRCSFVGGSACNGTSSG